MDVLKCFVVSLIIAMICAIASGFVITYIDRRKKNANNRNESNKQIW